MKAHEAQTGLCLHHRFQDQASSNPSGVAIVSGSQTVEYQQLDRRANYLAHRLARLGAGPEIRVGLIIKRSPGMVAALLAILKSGASYVPITPDTSRQRVDFVLANAGVSIVATQTDLAEGFSSEGMRMLAVDQEPGEAEAPPSIQVSPENAAYVIYTSGSTGRPKGVVVPHRAVCNYVEWACRHLPTREGNGSPVHTSIAFDLGLTNLFPPLLSGGSIRLLAEEDTIESLSLLLAEEGDFGVVKLTPSHLRALAALGRGWGRRRAARIFVSGGEQLHARDVEPWRGRVERFLNHYGPTEAAIGCCTWEIDLSRRLPSGTIPIGSAIPNLLTHVVDRDFERTPPGQIGELLIGGEGLARGYLGQPAMTAERFLPDPFSGRAGARLYRSGDLVRQRLDDALEFIGRTDDQVKIRGHRVEPGEAAAILMEHRRVREAAVISEIADDGEPFLTAYVVARPGLDFEELRLFAAKNLPEALVPRDFVRLEKLPLTASGKLDRQALPRPADSGIGRPVKLPKNPIEERMAKIWSEILNKPQPGVDENFFGLGGHSLLATRVVARVRREFEMELPLRALFESPTIEALSSRIEALPAAPDSRIKPRPKGSPPPLSFAQQRMWFLHQLMPANPLYNVPSAWLLKGRLNDEALGRTLNEIVRRHDSLRTRFEEPHGRVVQIVSAPATINLSVVDLTGLSRAKGRSQTERLVESEALRPFDLKRGPLMRHCLIRLSKRRAVLLLTLHHIVSDGWSTWVIRQELAEIYAALAGGRPSPFPELEVQYADFAAWQRGWLEGPRIEKQTEYWLNQLDDVTPLDLPTDHARPERRSFKGGQEVIELKADLVVELRRIALEGNATLFMLLLAAFQTLMHRLSGQQDIVVGTPVANRDQPETEKLIGYFANTLALRADFSSDPTFSELLQQVRKMALDAYENQDLPFERLVERLQPERVLNRNPIFEVIFALQNTPSPRLEISGLKIEDFGSEIRTVRFDLEFLLRETSDGGARGLVLFDRELFDAATARRICRQFEILLKGIAANPRRRVSLVPLLEDQDRRRILEWSGSPSPQPKEPVVHHLFQRQVRRSSRTLAVEFGDRRLTYGQLQSEALALASRLRGAGIGAEDRVALCGERSVEMIVAMLGVLQAGAAYVPLDSDYPASRLAYMLEDCKAAALLLGGGLDPAPFSHLGLPVWGLSGPVHQPDASSTLPHVSPDQLAYVMYTSGSTGRAKGVAVTHRAIVRLVHNTDYVQLEPGDRMAQISNPAFDASTFEIWGTLLNGARLVGVTQQEALDPQLLKARIQDSGLSSVFLTTSLFNQMARQDPSMFHGLKHLVIGGEAASTVWTRKVLDEARPRRLINGYGPTECTTFACWHQIEPRDVSHGQTSVPIGRPIANTWAYVADRHLRPLPIGVFGELLIGGPGLARGYLDRPSLTASAFVPSPFAPSGSRLYRTGDWAAFRADGVLDFKGRMDDQIKVRGFRVEPGEVEAALATHDSVEQSAVIAVEEASDTLALAAYVVPRSAQTAEAESLRKHLAKTLPAYMIPAFIAFLDHLPLNANGKLDRQALPVPRSIDRSRRRSAQPHTQTEILLARIWSKVLQRDQIGADEDFFDLGGHSLLATQAVSKIRAFFGIDLPLLELFETPTIRGLSQSIARHRATFEPIPESDGQDIPLSFAQRRLWFLDRLTPGRSFYNISSLWNLVGDLEITHLRAALNTVVARHQILRTRFLIADGQPLQVIDPARPLPLPIVDLQAIPHEMRSEEAKKICRAEARLPFDLEIGPLIRAHLIHLDARQSRLLVTQHHIISDGWSLGVFWRELAGLYDIFRAGASSSLPKVGLQYADFARRQQRRWKAGELERQTDYWSKRLEGMSSLELPRDHPRPQTRGFRGSRVSVRIPSKLHARLKALARNHKATLNMTLLAAFQVLLQRYTGHNDIALGCPIANRSQAGQDEALGCFVNTLVIRTNLADDPSFESVLAQVRRHSLEAFANQDLPFEKLVEHLAPSRDLGQNPLFQLIFSFLSPPSEIRTAGDLTFEPLEIETGHVRFDLELYMLEASDQLRAVFVYDSQLFEAATIENLSRSYLTLLRGAASQPARPISTLALLDPAQIELLNTQWGESLRALAHPPSVHALFEKQARRTPNAPAFRYRDQDMTYQGLSRRAQTVANRLSALGLPPESRIAVCLKRGPDLGVALLGILKAGCAYLPLDLGLPTARMQHLLADGQVAAIATRDRWRKMLPPTEGIPLILLDDATEAASPAASKVPSAEGDQLAYVLFTSGSTGQPKAVGVPHKAIVRLVKNTDYVTLGPDDRIANASDHSFDAATFEIWGALLNGGCVVSISRSDLLSPSGLARRITSERISTLFLTTALFNQAVRETPQAFRHLDRLLFGGEACQPDRVREALLRARPRRLLHVYGPTECTTFATWHEVQKVEAGATTVPIGGPISNTTVAILDSNLRPLPQGAVGELCLGGPGLARGYLGKPAVTAASFVPSALGPPGQRLYRTGDLARFNPKGQVEFVGRADQQVKIRGFRIEPGEIEAVLGSYAEVSKAAVMALPEGDGGRRLVAYLQAETAVTAEKVRDFLRHRLPSYMIPSQFVFLTDFPLTPSGKLDRQKLPAQSPSNKPCDSSLAPRNSLETRLAEIWKDILPVDQVGIRDDFFELGGHSLLATQVLARISRNLGIDLPLKSLFESPTIEGLAARLETASPSTFTPIPPIDRSQRIPLSFAQRRLWFLDQLHPNSVAYNIPAAWHLLGPLDLAALQSALNEVGLRHESLRTRFGEIDGRPHQIIEQRARLSILLVELRGLSEQKAEVEAQSLANREASCPFRLDQGPLMRVMVVRLQDERHLLIINQHHIISDGWSLGIFIDEFAELYSAFAEGRPSPLAELDVQYADFAVWQRGWLRGDTLERRLDYWRKRLAGAPALDLPTDFPRPTNRRHRGRRKVLQIDPQATAALMSLARQTGTTLFATLLSSFQAFLCRYSGQTDFVVGSPVASRNHADVESVIGFFVNALPLRASISVDLPFRQHLEQTSRQFLLDYMQQEVPFEKVVEALGVERDLRRNPIFQVMFALQNTPGTSTHLAGLKMESVEIENRSTRFDLALYLQERDGGIRGTLLYDEDLFADETAERMARHFEAIISSIVEDPDKRLCELNFISEDERRQVVNKWNQTENDFPQDRCLHHLIQAQARRTPTSVAASHEGLSVTYGTLNRQANSIAHLLVQQGAESEARVGLLLDRSCRMLAALLGILKSGAAFVPLDLRLPPERLSFIVRDAALVSVVTDAYLAPRLDAVAHVPLVLLEEELEESDEDFGSRVASDNVAYVIYTSGSTGAPKGVCVPHRALVNYVTWCAERFDASSRNVAVHSSLAYDLGMTALFPPLVRGGRLELLSEENGLDELAQALRLGKLDFVKLTPSHLKGLSAISPDSMTVDTLIVGGEQLNFEDLRHCRGGVRRIVNHYGPTETTVGCCTWEVESDSSSTGPVAIGHPIDNMRTYVLDQRLRPLPVGVAGELCIAGVGLARGYLGHPGLTAEKFCPNPLGDPGQRLYRSGDKVKRLKDGRLQFLGRLDDQIKVHGHRVELGEVAATIRRFPGVGLADVALKGTESGRQVLVSYIVGEAAAVDTRQLASFVARRLPEYMCPDVYMFLPELPLTPNGKLDQRALPIPKIEDQSRPWDPPQGPQEQRLAQVFADVLGLERVGRSDDFFKLGGHSLLATQAVLRIRRNLGKSLPLRDIFEASTVESLSRRLFEATDETPPPIMARTQQSDPPLSFAQERMWFIERLFPGRLVFNLPMSWKLRGKVQVKALNRALAELIRRHEALRTCYPLVEGRPVQRILPALPDTLLEIDLRRLPRAMRLPESQRLSRALDRMPFDLSCERPIRSVIIRTGDRESLFKVTLHHIAGDGWSLGVFRRELSRLYDSSKRRRPSPLAKMPIQYSDFAIWQREWLSGPTLEKQLAFWKKSLPEESILELPTDSPRQANRSYRGGSEAFRLPCQLVRQLNLLSQAQETTLYMTTLAAFHVLLHRYTGQKVIVTGSPVANRNHTGIGELIGCFINTLAIASDVSENPPFDRLLSQVRDSCLQAYAHQDTPFELLVERFRPRRDLHRNPLIQVLFALQNAPVDDLQLDQLTVESEAVALRATPFDLELSMREYADGLHGVVLYDSDLFRPDTIRRFIGHYKRLLMSAVEAPQQRVGYLELMSQKERRRQLAFGSGPLATWPCDSVHERFLEQARRSPKAIACRTDATTLSYRELARRSTKTASALRELGVGPESIIGLCLPRDIVALEAMLAIWMAGAAYLPLDPTYPRRRLAYMIEDAGAELVLVDSRFRRRLDGVASRVVDLQVLRESVTAPRSTIQDAQRGQLAYLMYTSGSTGRPKGVEITHSGAVNFLEALRDLLDFEPNHRLLAATTLSFDISFLELFLPLVSGGSVEIADDEAVRDPERLSALLRRSKADFFQATPAGWRFLLDWGWKGEKRLTALCGGESLPGELADRLKERCGCLWNLYGPTETTVWSAASPAQWRADSPALIAGPIANTRLWVLDEHQRQRPIGVPGELCISGEGLARGYRAQARLTAERFLPNPFGTEGGRLYRTGDLVRLRPGGTIEFLGRLDQQVKIRGYRVEAGEVEATLAHHPNVAQAAVVVHLETLRAFVCASSPDPALSPKKLTNFLSQRLPSHMIPSAYHFVESLPLTSNRKVDRKALQAMAKEPTRTRRSRKKPISPTARQLAALWKEVLGLDEVGTQDGFFELGGYSLLAVRLITLIRERLGVEIPLVSVFQNPKLQDLTRTVKAAMKSSKGKLSALAPVDASIAHPLSFLQERWWLLKQKDGENDPNQVQIVKRLTGPLNTDVLERALSEIVQRHSSLRTSFRSTDSGPVQIVGPAMPISVPVIDLSSLAPSNETINALIALDAKQSFEVEKGLLLRAAIFRVAHDEHILLLTGPHMALDGWSVGIVMNELVELYRAFLHGLPSPLPEPSVQYIDFAVWQRRFLSQKKLKELVDYWKQQLVGSRRLFRPPKKPTFQGKRIEMVLPLELAKDLELLSRAENVTLFITMMTAFKILLHQISGRFDITVGTPSLNRSPALDSVVGIFANNLALRSDLSGDPTFQELMSRVNKTLVAASAKQDLPYGLLVEEIRRVRNLQRNPLFQAMLQLNRGSTGPRWMTGELTMHSVDFTPTRRNSAWFPLLLVIQAEEKGIRGVLTFRADYFSEEFIHHLLERYQRILCRSAEDRNLRLSQLDTALVAPFIQASTKRKTR